MLKNKNLKGIQKVRRGLKKTDSHKDLDDLMDDAFFERFHDKVMAEVEKREMQPAPVLLSARRRLRQHFREWLYPAGGVMAVLTLMLALWPQMQKVNESMYRAGLVSDGTARIVQQALSKHENIAQTFISTQSEADFFIDVASESFENLPDKRIEKLILGEGRR